MNLRTSIPTLFGGLSLVAFVACSGGGGGTTPPPTPVVAVSISPLTASVVAGGTQAFTATVTNSTNTAVTWSVQEGSAGGTVVGGLYTASGTPGTYHVLATSVADATKSATATVTVTAAPATSLSYTDPTTGMYRLVKNAALSSPTHLVLDLTGVGAPSGAGVAFTFTADATRATWAKVTGTDAEYVQNGAVLNLGTAPLALKGKVAGATLTGAVGQKGLGASLALNGVLARVALDFKAGAPLGAVSLTSPKAQILQADGTIATVSVTLGTLTAN